MKVYTLDPTSVPDDLVHFFNTLIGQNLTRDYSAFLLEMCRTFMNAIDSDEEYFIVKNSDVFFEKNFSVDDVFGSTWVESLSGSDMACAVYSKEFARMYINNVDFRQSHEVIVRAMYPNYKTGTIHAIDTYPLTNGFKRYSDVKWQQHEHNFIRGFTCTNIKFTDIMEDYEKMMFMKKKVEEYFLELYGVPITIRDYKCIKTTFEIIGA